MSGRAILPPNDLLWGHVVAAWEFPESADPDLIGAVMLATILPLALVVGLSPLPILPAVLLLMTPRATGNGPAYLGAFVISLTLVLSAAFVVARATNPAPVDEQGIGWIKVCTGVVFLLLACLKWIKRPGPGQSKEAPAWMAALDGYTPARSARLGCLLAVANPKILLMALAAGAEMALLADGSGHAIAAGLLFVGVGSLGVSIPVLTHAVLGHRSESALSRGRLWLEANQTVLSVAVLVVLAALLLADGVPR